MDSNHRPLDYQSNDLPLIYRCGVMRILLKNELQITKNRQILKNLAGYFLPWGASGPDVPGAVR
jgi:hypothetical protein